jgi:DNA damage-binding protein 1
LDELCRVSLGTDTQVRDILAVRLGDKVFLMIGVGDGHLITYSVEMLDASQEGGGGLPVLANKRKGALGTHAISFSCFLNANELCVFASCDRPTVIYCRNGKLLFSAVNASQGEVLGMTPFSSELFPACLAMVSESALVIGTIEDIQKIHIQTIPLGEAPRRIVHNLSAGVYAGLFNYDLLYCLY